MYISTRYDAKEGYQSVEVLRLYIDGVTDGEHEIDLKVLAEALRPYLEGTME